MGRKYDTVASRYIRQSKKQVFCTLKQRYQWKKITRRTTGARGSYFQTSVYQVIKASLNLDKISKNTLNIMRIVQKVSHIMFAHKICLQVSGTKYLVIRTSCQVSGTKSK